MAGPRTFPGDPNPPPKFVPPAAPVPQQVTPEQADKVNSVARALVDEEFSTPTGAAHSMSPDTFWVRRGRNPRDRALMYNDKDGEARKLRPLYGDGLDDVLSASGKKDFLGNWVVTKEQAEVFQQGKLPFFDYIKQQWVAASSGQIRGSIGELAMSGKMSFKDAAAQGDIELLTAIEADGSPFHMLSGALGAAWKSGHRAAQEANAFLKLPAALNAASAEFAASAVTDPFITDFSGKATAKWVAGSAAAVGQSIAAGTAEGALPAAALSGGALILTGVAGVGAAAALPLVGGMAAIGMTYGVFRNTVSAEGGNLALDMYQKGLDEDTIKRAAPIAGGIMGMLEVAGFRFLTAPFKRQWAKNVLGSDAVRQAQATWLANYFKETGGEVSTEVAQELASNLTNNIVAAIDEKPEAMVTKEAIATAVLNAALEATAGMAVIRLPGAALDYAGSRAVKRGQKAALSAAEDGGAGIDPAVASEKEIEGAIVRNAAQVMEEEDVVAMEAARGRVDDFVASEPTVEAAQEFGKTVAEDDGAKAVLHAKSLSLNAKLDAISEGGEKGVSALTGEAQIEAVRMSARMRTITAILSGIELSSVERMEPMLPHKEKPVSNKQKIERTYREQEGAIRAIDKANAALNRELELQSRLYALAEVAARGKKRPKPRIAPDTGMIEPSAQMRSIAAAMARLEQEIQDNEEKAALLIFTPAGMEESVTQAYGEAGVEALVGMRTIANLEKELQTRVASAYSSGIRAGAASAKREVKKVQGFIIGMLKAANIDADQKSKFLSAIRGVQTLDDLNRAYPEIRDRVFKAEAERRAKVLDALLAKTVKAASAKIVDRKVKGSIGNARIQDIVDRVQKALKHADPESALEAAENTLVAMANGSYEGEMAAETQLAQFLEVNALRYAAGRLDPLAAAEFVQNVVTLIEEAKSAFYEHKKKESEQWAKDLQEIKTEIVGPDFQEPGTVEAVPSGAWAKGLRLPRKLIGYAAAYLYSINTYAHLLARRSGKKKGTAVIEDMLSTEGMFALDRSTRQKYASKEEELFHEAYGLDKISNPAVRLKEERKLKLKLYRKQRLGTFTNTKGARGANVTSDGTSRAEAIRWYMLLQDPELSDNFRHPDALAWSEDMINAVLNILTPEDRAFAAGMFKLFDELYRDANEVYSLVNGINLPKADFYAGRIRVFKRNETVKQDLSYNLDGSENLPGSSAGPSFKRRVRHRYPIRQEDIFRVYTDHVYAVSHFVATELWLKKANRILGDASVREAITGVYGRTILSNMLWIKDRIRAGAHERALIHGLDRLITNMFGSLVTFRPVATLIQLSALPAFAVGVPIEHTHKLMAEFAGVFKNGLDKDWMNHPFVKSRGLNQTETVAAMAELSKRVGANWVFNPEDLVNIGAVPIKVGDFLSIYAGGTALYRYYRGQGLSKELALAKTAETAKNTQSSGAITDLSVMQLQTGFYRVFTAFMNQPLQMMRYLAETAVDMTGPGFWRGEGRISRREAFKTILIMHVITPMTYQFVVDGFDFDEEHQLRAAVLGHFNALPMIAQILNAAYNVVMQEDDGLFPLSDPINSGVQDVIDAISDLADAEDFSDYAKSFEMFADVIARGAFAFPLMKTTRFGKVTHEWTEGERTDEEYIKAMAGYTDRMIEEQEERKWR